MTSHQSTVRPRIRVLRGRDVALGPGKADLLAAIAETGSISAAARALAMSYSRAWKLVRVMNRCFASPVVVVSRGGPSRGGATLSRSGRAVLVLYRRMERKSLGAIGGEIADMERHLR